ncbi:hypothetical protein Tco_1182811 [Tanacetum coccineum]
MLRWMHLMVPLKKKDQIALDEEMARNLKAQIQAKLIEEERLARKKEEEANIALIESWDNTQAMMEANSEVVKSKEEPKESSKEHRNNLNLKSQKGTKVVKKKAEGNRKKSISKKRAGKEQKQESSKSKEIG